MEMYTNLFTTGAINTIQGFKKNWVDTYVKEEILNVAMNKFVAAQTKYTMEAVKAFDEFNNSLGEYAASKMREDK